MFEVFIKERRQVKLLRRNHDQYLVGYIMHFNPSKRIVTFHDDETHEIPMDSILHIYQPK